MARFTKSATAVAAMLLAAMALGSEDQAACVQVSEEEASMVLAMREASLEKESSLNMLQTSGKVLSQPAATSSEVDTNKQEEISAVQEGSSDADGSDWYGNGGGTTVIHHHHSGPGYGYGGYGGHGGGTTVIHHHHSGPGYGYGGYGGYGGGTTVVHHHHSGPSYGHGYGGYGGGGTTVVHHHSGWLQSGQKEDTEPEVELVEQPVEDDDNEYFNQLQYEDHDNENEDHDNDHQDEDHYNANEDEAEGPDREDFLQYDEDGNESEEQPVAALQEGAEGSTDGKKWHSTTVVHRRGGYHPGRRGTTVVHHRRTWYGGRRTTVAHHRRNRYGGRRTTVVHHSRRFYR